MSTYINIEKFNTHSMPEEVVLGVSSNREYEIAEISRIINDKLSQPDTRQHIVLIGPSGIGKSFLLRYFQIITQRQENWKSCINFILLPEEQNNIFSPTQFINEILNRYNENSAFTKVATWGNKEENWESAVEILEKTISNNVRKLKKYLLIVGVENLDLLLERAFPSKDDQKKFRNLLSSLPNFMLICSSRKYESDPGYNKPIFHEFWKYELKHWTEEDCIQYFNKRYYLVQKGKF